MLISVDPSSTCTGLAFSRGPDIISCHRLYPPDGAALARIRWMVTALNRKLDDLAAEDHTLDAIMEIVSGKVHRGHAGAGLAILGLAQGMILAALEHHPAVEVVHTVTAEKWIKQLPSFARRKGGRATFAKLLFPQYNHENDQGRDMGDAICLLDWWRTKGSLTVL